MTDSASPNEPPTRRVLIVDDNESIRRLVRYVLERHDIAVSEADDGLAFWRSLDNAPPDMVLMDVLLGEEDGGELIREMKSHPRHHAIPAIFLTNLTETSDVVRGFEIGAVDYIKKPLNAPEMLARIETHLRLAEAESVLARARDEAIAANKAKNEFVARVSHEIRTPLNGVLGMLQTLLKSPLEPEQKEWSRVALQSGQNLLHLINEILDFSKMEAAHFEIEEVIFAVDEAFSSSLALLAHQAKDKGLAFSANLQAGIPLHWSGDALRINQMIVNLLSNALKFTQEGHVSLELLVDPNAIFTILVSDTGIGIAPEIQERLFAPFEQADSQTTRRYGGTGLGLTIVKRLAELMGGSVTLESVVGQGSTFTIKLPLKATTTVTSPGQSLICSNVEGCGTPVTTPTYRHQESLHVLIAEDSHVNQEVARMMVDDFGHTYRLVGDGEEAIEALGEENFDVVLMDIQMPRKDGVSATEEIRDPFSFVLDHQIYVIALTASTIADEQAKFRAAGMDLIVPKPVDEGTLFQALDKAIAHQKKRGIELPPVSDVSAAPQTPDPATATATPTIRVSPLLWRIFREQSQELIGAFEAALEASNLTALARTAHTLAGSGGQVGLSELYGLAKRIEAAAKNNDLPAVQMEAPRLRHLLLSLPEAAPTPGSVRS